MVTTSEISGRTDAASGRKAEAQPPTPEPSEYILPLSKSALFWIAASLLGWAILLGAFSYIA